MDHIKSLLQQGKIKEALKKFRALSEADQEDFFEAMAPTLFPPFTFSVLFRKLRPGKTYEDFHKAWLPPLKKGQDLAHYFPVPTYVFNGENQDDSSDIISIGLVWAQEAKLTDIFESSKETESMRHDRIDTVAEKIGPTLIYKTKDVTKLGS